MAWKESIKRHCDDLDGWGVAAFLGLNLFVRLWMFFRSGVEWSGVTQTDEGSYLRIAGELSAAGLKWLVSERSVQAAPGHILLLGLVGGSVSVVKVLSVAASTATLLPLIAIARRVLPRRATIWVAVAFTTCLGFAAFATTILTESINAFFLTSAIALLIEALARARPRWALASGVVLGLATLWRATTLLYPLALALLLAAAWLIGPLRRRLAFDVAPTLKLVAIQAVGLAVIVIPFIVKNGIVAGQWKLATGQGATTYLGADPKTVGWEPYFSGYNFDTIEVSAPYSHIEPEGDRRLSEAALRQIRRDPLGTLAMRIHWPLRLFIGEPQDVFNPVASAPQSWTVLNPSTALLAVWNLGWRVCAFVFGIWFLAGAWRRADGFVLLSVPLYFLVLFLSMFVISRFSLPLLPLMSVALVGGLSQRGPGRWVAGLATVALVAAVSFWHTVFPPAVDPARYAQHTELGRWGAQGTRWRAFNGAATLPDADGRQAFIAVDGAPNLVSEGGSIALEHNQVVLLALRATLPPAGWGVHVYWRTRKHPAFSEEHTTDVYATEGEPLVVPLAAEPGDTLEGVRLDLDLPEGATGKLGESGVQGWACHFGCTGEVSGTTGFAFRGGAGPEAIGGAWTVPLDAPVSLSIPFELKPVPRAAGADDQIVGTLRWQLTGDTAFRPENARSFGIPVDGALHWIHINPSLFPGDSKWTGSLEKLSLNFSNARGVRIELGPTRLLKDYRMLRP